MFWKLIGAHANIYRKRVMLWILQISLVKDKVQELSTTADIHEV